MATYTDDFNRANESPLASPWQTCDNGGLAIVSNQVVSAAAGSEHVSALTGEPWDDDQSAQVTVTNVNGYDFAGVAVRMDASGNGYVGMGQFGDGQFYCYRLDAGVWTELGFRSVSFAANDTLGIGVVGSTITLYKNGVAQGATFSDSTYSAGAPGIAYTRGDSNLTTIDDFVATGHQAAGGGDTTAPILSNPNASATGSTAASGSVSTNEANGTLYYVATANATESIATVKAGASQAVSLTGTQNVSLTGLTENTAYYLHFVHTDASGNDSGRVSSAQFTTDAAPQAGSLTVDQASISPGGSVTWVTSLVGIQRAWITDSLGNEFDLTGVSDTGGALPALSHGLNACLFESGLTISVFDGTDTATDTIDFVVSSGDDLITVTGLSGSLTSEDWGYHFTGLANGDQATFTPNSGVADLNADGTNTNNGPGTIAIYGIKASDGGVSLVNYTNEPADETPDAFTFTDLTGQTRSVQIESNAITVTGIDAVDIAVSVTGGSWSKSTDGGSTWTPWSVDPGTVTLNDVVKGLLDTSANYSTTTSLTIDINGVSDTFSVTTENGNVQDTEAPTISINSGTDTITVGDTWVDAGATVTDNVDATTTIYADMDTVNGQPAGTYQLTYNYTDAAGNVAVQQTRTVVVMDTGNGQTITVDATPKGAVRIAEPVVESIIH